MKLLEINDLTVKYGEREVVRKVNFDVEEGKWLMIAGPNGAGKSTILNAISRGVPYGGKIRYKGEDIKNMKPALLARHIGVLAQNHMVGYDYTVQEVVKLGRYAYRQKVLQEDSGTDRTFVDKALELTGLAELRHQSVLALSGGEVQRTFLAQLFAQDPDLMILDEPANHLDLVYQKQVFELISEWLKSPGRAVISVVHDLSLAKKYGSDCILMNEGSIISSGSIEDVLTPEKLNNVYNMDVYDWMRNMLSQWK